MFKKRIAFIVSIILITILCYIFMNRNFDPLARYSYELNAENKELILNKLDEREIKYIVDYEIDYNDFMPFIKAYRFNVYNSEYYKKAKSYLYQLNDYEIVDVVEKILSNKNIVFDDFIEKIYDHDYYTIINYDLK